MAELVFLIGAYLIRLLAFVLILVAVVNKNRVRGGSHKGSRSS